MWHGLKWLRYQNGKTHETLNINLQQSIFHDQHSWISELQQSIFHDQNSWSSSFNNQYFMTNVDTHSLLTLGSHNFNNQEKIWLTFLNRTLWYSLHSLMIVTQQVLVPRTEASVLISVASNICHANQVKNRSSKKTKLHGTSKFSKQHSWTSWQRCSRLYFLLVNVPTSVLLQCLHPRTDNLV